MFRHSLHALSLIAMTMAACSGMASSRNAETSSPAIMTTTPSANEAHPVIGPVGRLAIHRYRPDQVRTVTAAAEIAQFVAVFAPTHVASMAMPRTMPAVEVVFYDIAGTARANASFLGPDDDGFVYVHEHGTRPLAADESRSLRALLARFP